MKAFPEERLNQILCEIEKLSQNSPGPKYAAFDADGTLWSHDMGEMFFEYQIQSGKLKSLPENPWAHYENLKVEESPEAAYLWLAQINKGQALKDVQTWAEECVQKNSPLPIFEFQKTLIPHLRQAGFTVYIVTASIAWAVEPAARRLGIEENHVLGVRTQIENGIVTDRQDGIITYRDGKIRALLEKTKGVNPLFCAGNTEGDLALLEASEGLRLVISSASEKDSNYKTELKMQQLAAERNWFCHSFSS